MVERENFAGQIKHGPVISELYGGTRSIEHLLQGSFSLSSLSLSLSLALCLSFAGLLVGTGLGGPYDFSRSVVLPCPHGARSRTRVGRWIGPKPDRRTHYLIHAHVRAREARTGVGVRDGAPVLSSYWWGTRGWSDGGKRDRERVRAEREMGAGALSSLLLSLSPPSFPSRTARAALVHFLLSKIMTMLIFLTREEFFKLTCNQT